MISKNSIEHLKSVVDIVDLISNYLELKKRGANFKAKCPFHSEKTPSFVVNPVKQMFHCFGCGVGGDSIKFIMEIEKLSYKEAIEKIAFLYNIQLEYENKEYWNSYLESSEILNRVQEWYRSNLYKYKIVLEYLKSRNVSETSIEIFGIGFAPKNGLIEFLKEKNIPLERALEAGLINKDEKSKKFYARLTDRITFPIHSVSGVIVGFGGRTITNHPAKYINSPQTKLFNKSKLLYAYHISKNRVFKEKKIIVSEGYLDVIMLHQANFKVAVATLGTALTAEHLPILKKGEPKVILSYDGDSAGLSAGFKASKLLAINGFDGGIVIFPENKDPADLVKSGELEQLKALFDKPIPFVEFVIKQITLSFNLKNPTEKEKAFKEVKSFLDKLSPILRDEYILQASLTLKVPEEYFRSKKSKNIELPLIDENKSDDIFWKSIIKTVLQNKNFLDELLNVISLERIESNYIKSLIEILIKDDLENEKLIAISIDETVKTLNEDEFKRALLLYLIKFYKSLLQQIVNSQELDYKSKSYWIRKIKIDIIPRIKKGELVVYEGNIPV